MDYRNKLGVFTFDDDTQESHIKLVACTAMGQYLNPKPGTRALSDEESIYEFILNDCGNVLALVGFDIVINEDVRIYTPAQLKDKKIHDFDARIAAAAEALAQRHLNELLDQQEKRYDANPSFGGWLVGPAALVGHS